ncbi:cation:proton antiporter domain-containing protein [Anthocerotibacter panamensis]|uniref:cation:proton antiporter domain-containing protein n=1 Tax=Anthocerotibacter panamensis TaxID=2857077 RepID=UPI001FDA1B9B|nr:cation:proton antiporter [Anthocerotibacter panamensis]
MTLTLLLGTDPAHPPGMIQPLSHDTILLFLTQLVLLVVMARGLGEVMQRLNQPPVIGELLAGIVLGPSVLGVLFPGLEQAIFPRLQLQSDLLSAMAWIGVLFLLFVTGLEMDLPLIQRKGRTAILISASGIALPFTSGFLLGMVLPDTLVAESTNRLVFSLFLGVAMSITALPVLAKVLIDLKLIRRDIGQITLAAGMSDDVVGWLLLSVVSGLASSGVINLAAALTAIGGALIFLTLAFTIGRVWVGFLVRWVDDELDSDAAMAGTLVVLLLTGATLTHWLHIEAALGAFTTGILVGQSPRLRTSVRHSLETVTVGFLAPIFFASAGLKVNLASFFAQPQFFSYGLIILAVACIGKLAGAYLGARLGGLGHWEGLSLGAGMNARGALEIIVATIGLGLGILNPEMFSIIVLMAMATSIMAPPLLRLCLARVTLKPDEAARLAREELALTSFVQSIRRVLLPTRGGANVQLAAQLVSHIARHQPIEVTALYAVTSERPTSPWKNWLPSQENGQDLQEVRTALETVATEMQLPSERPLVQRVLFGNSKRETILKEAQKGYSLMVLGATEQEKRAGVLFNSLVDDVLRQAPCAILVVKSHLPLGDACPIGPQRFKRILVPTVGTEYAKHAAEFAYALAQDTGALVTLLHVVTQPRVQGMVLERQNLEEMITIGQQIVDVQAELSHSYKVEVETRVVVGDSPEKEIVAIANQSNFDLVILGTLLREIGLRAFFGHRVEYVLDQTNCPVAVLTSA